MKGGGRPLTPADLEQGFLKDLPKDYQAFLLLYNGGAPDRQRIRFANGGTVLAEFHASGEGTSFALGARDEVVGTAAGYHSIAVDIGGNDILLSVQPETFGQVYWKDHSLSAGEPQRIATSFTEFAKALEAPRQLRMPAADPIERLGKTGTAADLDAFLELGGRLDDLTLGNGLSIAQHAARHGNLPLVKELAARGASMNEVLHCATACGQRDVAAYLLDELHLDINRPDAEGYTPLQGAYLHPEMEVYLISRGAR